MNEALGILIVKHHKSLSVNVLGHLESSAAWLMQIAMIRASFRCVTWASRAFGSRRRNENEGEIPGPLRQFGRNVCRWITAAPMLHIMRVAGLLNVRHRGSEWLCNVFSTPPTRMNIIKDPDTLKIRENRTLTAMLLASVIFPDVFGPLTDEDRENTSLE